ncbi:hypothetical protein LVD17_22425 [Fulvivirga ulvae]|uniref:hypothetical protein n=1 Tax=Fulvivirga ulvae TaxID=2904245 RepID=UPI001F214EC3|nr:hypothetical protein [Fulvivirga ulvae]UII31052.1 hypothetical protein LVD17_22425 [Fulvivirga ulvae]
MISKVLNIGVRRNQNFRERRIVQVINAITLIIGPTLMILSIVNFAIGETLNAYILLTFSLIYFSNIYWNESGRYIISKVILAYLITLNPFLHLLINGYTPSGQYLSYMIVTIILVTVTTFLFSGKTDRKIYFVTLFYYFFWVCFIDKIIYALSDPKPQIDFLIENYYFYKAPTIAGLLIVTLIINIFIGIINRYEEVLSDKNRELEKRVRERTKKLSETYDRIVNLGFITSHEIRGPLASILGITRLFIHNKNVHGLEEEINKLHEKSEEMDRVINRMTRELEDSPDSRELY